jgi:hypothetical protein
LAPIFGVKNHAFLEKQCYEQFFFVFEANRILSKKTAIFLPFLGEIF